MSTETEEITRLKVIQMILSHLPEMSIEERKILSQYYIQPFGKDSKEIDELIYKAHLKKQSKDENR